MGSSPSGGAAFFMEKTNTIDFVIKVGLWLRLSSSIFINKRLETKSCHITVSMVIAASSLADLYWTVLISHVLTMDYRVTQRRILTLLYACSYGLEVVRVCSKVTSYRKVQASKKLMNIAKNVLWYKCKGYLNVGLHSFHHQFHFL